MYFFILQTTFRKRIKKKSNLKNYEQQIKLFIDIKIIFLQIFRNMFFTSSIKFV